MDNDDQVMRLRARQQVLLQMRLAVDLAEKASQQTSHQRTLEHNNVLRSAYLWARREFIAGELKHLDEQIRNLEE